MTKLKEQEDTFIEKLRSIFVTIDTFNLRLSPIEKIVYGAATAIGLAVLGAGMAFILRKP
jgi:hypothetical protein